MGQFHLAVGDVDCATEVFAGLLSEAQTMELSPYKIAGMTFRLAQAAEREADVSIARYYAQEADRLLHPLQSTPRLTHEVKQFLAALKPPAYISVGSAPTS